MVIDKLNTDQQNTAVSWLFSLLIGGWVAGNGTPYDINIYGSTQLTPILPWIRNEKNHAD